MPRCLMAKKFKAYTWPERPEPPEEEEEEIDVVGDSPSSCWGPSSPTAGATAPSPPPTSPHGTTLLYNGNFFKIPSFEASSRGINMYVSARNALVRISHSKLFHRVRIFYESLF